MRDGIAPGERNLYPAMPFVFSHITTPDDIDALYAYNMSIPAMPIANKSNTGVFVLPVRPFMDFWTLLNFPDRKVLRNDQRSAEWNRGAYLVEGLAHCGSCHSPRNFMMGVEFSRSLQGGEVDGVVVPDITAAALAKRGFDVPTLSTYLATGMAPQAPRSTACTRSRIFRPVRWNRRTSRRSPSICSPARTASWRCPPRPPVLSPKPPFLKTVRPWLRADWLYGVVCGLPRHGG